MRWHATALMAPRGWAVKRLRQKVDTSSLPPRQVLPLVFVSLFN